MPGAVVCFRLDDFVACGIKGQLVVPEQEVPVPGRDVVDDLMRLDVPVFQDRHSIVDQNAAVVLKQQRPEPGFFGQHRSCGPAS